ncbi:GNAT family N-acetyltransferase [Streptomyces sp. O3]
MSQVMLSGIELRRPVVDDHPRVLRVLDHWWGEFEGSAGSAQRALLLPRLYFQHFTSSSFVAEENGEIVGFLIGFHSQSVANESYIHFVGVAPEWQRRGLGRRLYGEFFELSRNRGSSVVRSVTSAANADSYRFHTRMGFTAEPGPKELDGRPLQPDYDGPGFDRVAFVRAL